MAVATESLPSGYPSLPPPPEHYIGDALLPLFLRIRNDKKLSARRSSGMFRPSGDSFLMAEIERNPLCQDCRCQELPMTRPETNETHKEPDRDPRGFCVGLVGILLLATWTCLILIQKRHPPKGGFTAVTSQAKSGSSPTADTAAHYRFRRSR